jgi:hypothetical protein
MKNKSIYNKFRILVFSLAIYSIVFAPLISATEFVISDNGTGSSNEISSQNTSETTVTQQNTADVSNDVSVDANTGNNNASGNTDGSVVIDTGNVHTNVTVENQVNSSAVETFTCCQNETNAQISGNGTDSGNSINLDNKTNTNINVYQNATVTNNISGYVNTGKNTANDNNGGSVTIETGNINVKSKITNGAINTSLVNISGGSGESINAKISENGTGTINEIRGLFNNNIFSNIINNSNVYNNSSWYLNTGENKANGNSAGKVLIKTGDINLDVFINNLLNISITDIDTCCADVDIFDPGDDEDPQEEEKSETEDEDGVADPDISVKSDPSGIIPAGAEAGAGGPGILGLSDTSGGLTHAIMFWMGLGLFAIGGKMITDEYASKKTS